jgi:uncharacterized protein YdcH (DUF465 family)
MDVKDIELIEKFAGQDPLLRTLYEEHRTLDKKLLKLSKKPYLTPAEENEEQKLKKLKLAGKDRIMKILEKYR